MACLMIILWFWNVEPHQLNRRTESGLWLYKVLQYAYFIWILCSSTICTSWNARKIKLLKTNLCSYTRVHVKKKTASACQRTHRQPMVALFLDLNLSIVNGVWALSSMKLDVYAHVPVFFLSCLGLRYVTVIWGYITCREVLAMAAAFW